MVGNTEVAPVDTVAPDAPSDTTEVGTPIKPQATTEDSTQQETTLQQEATETEQQTILAMIHRAHTYKCFFSKKVSKSHYLYKK